MTGLTDPKDIEAFWEETDKRFKFEDDFLRKRGWTPNAYYDDNSGVSEWKAPSGEIVEGTKAYDRMTSEYLEEKGWRVVYEVERHGNAEWKKPITQWWRCQSPVTKRVYTYLDAQHIMEKDWDESVYPVECCGHSKMLNDLIGPDFTGTHIKTWFYLTFDENHETKERVFVHWTMQQYMIDAGLAILNNPTLHHDQNKHWSDIPFIGGVSNEVREKLYQVAWHGVNDMWGYTDD